MIHIGDTSVNPMFIVSAELDTRHYMNGSATYLVVKLADGTVIRREHGFGFDAFKIKDQIDNTAPQGSA